MGKVVPDPGGMNGNYKRERIRGKAWSFLNGHRNKIGHFTSETSKINLDR